MHAEYVVTVVVGRVSRVSLLSFAKGLRRGSFVVVVVVGRRRCRRSMVAVIVALTLPGLVPATGAAADGGPSSLGTLAFLGKP